MSFNLPFKDIEACSREHSNKFGTTAWTGAAGEQSIKALLKLMHLNNCALCGIGLQLERLNNNLGKRL